MASKSRSASERPTRHDIPPERRRALVQMLNVRLASSLDLYAQTKHAHWNVVGKDFWQLHLLFDTLAENVEEHADLVAERVTALGGVANGTLRMGAAASTLPEFPADLADGMGFVAALADRYALHATECREQIGEAEDLEDPATADLLTEMVRDLDKALYFLEAHLRGRKT